MRKEFTVMFMALTAAAQADTVGLWSFDEVGAAPGGELSTAANVVDPGNLDGVSSRGAPRYSADVPAAEIFDPISGSTYTNGFSFDASGGGARLLTPDFVLGVQGGVTYFLTR